MAGHSKHTKARSDKHVRSNRQILTQGQKYVTKQHKKFGAEEVTFNKDSRLDFLTGFHKRKLERKKKAQEFNKEQDRLARIEERKKVRDERKQQFEVQMDDFQKKMSLQFDSDDEETKAAENEEWEGFGSDEEKEGMEGVEEEEGTIKPILKKNVVNTAVYGEDTTVEIETLEPNDNFEYLARMNNVKLEKAGEVLDESITRATKYAKFLGMGDKDAEEGEKKKQKKKKFRYLTKTERKVNQMKLNKNKRRS